MNPYTIQQGDTLGGIAAKNNTTVQALSSINNISDPNKINAGQTINLSSPNTQSSLSSQVQNAILNYGKTPSSSALQNTPVNTTPTASSLNNTPVNVPPVPQTTSTSANTAINNVGALNGNNGQNITPSQTALLNTTDSGLNTAQANYQNQKDQTAQLINQYLGMGQDQQQQEQAAGVPQLQTNANQLTQQYNAAQATYNSEYNTILNDPNMTREQAAQRIDDLQQQHGYNLTNIGIQQSIAQNDYNNAETLIQHQIQLKYGALSNAITFQQQFLAQNQAQLSQAQQNSFAANLAVQQQMYTQQTYYSQLNASTGMDILKSATTNGAPQNIIQNISQVIGQGGSAADVAAASQGYAATGSYSLTYNPATDRLEMANALTGKFLNDGTTIPPNSKIIDQTDPSAAKIYTGADGSQYNMAAYNGSTDSNYTNGITASSTAITNAIGGQITTIQQAQSAITKFAPTSFITGAMVISAATNNNVDPTALLSQMKWESGIGVSNVAKANNNFGGIKYTGSQAQLAAGVVQGTAIPTSEGKGYYAKFPSAQAGLDYEANLLNQYKIPPSPIVPGQTPKVQNDIQTIQQIKAALPSNLSGAVSYINSTGDGYIDLSKVQDLPGFPTGYAKNQATAYAKQFGLAILNDTQVQAVQDYDTAMQNVNTLQNLWNSVAPKNVAESAIDSLGNAFNMTFKTGNATQLVQYNTSALSAISTLNQIVGSKRLSNFSTSLSQDSVPHLPVENLKESFLSADTLGTGNGKLDNIRNDLNNSLKSISNVFKAAPLSGELTNTPIPQAGQTVNIGGVNYKFNADGSATIVGQ